MMKRIVMLGAGAVGYVFGARAGRERYEQIARSAQKLRNNPKVQQSVDEAKAKAKEAASTAAEKVRGGKDSDDTDVTAAEPMGGPSTTLTSPVGMSTMAGGTASFPDAGASDSGTLTDAGTPTSGTGFGRGDLAP